MTHTLELERRRGNDSQATAALRYLSNANRLLYLYEEGIRQVKEALEIAERIGDTIEQAECLSCLTSLLIDDEQLDAAEKAASRAIDLVPEGGQEFLVCELHVNLGKINQYKGEREKALHHYETSLRIASPFNWHCPLFWIHYNMAKLFGDGRELDDESAHIEQAKSHAVDGAMQYKLGGAMVLQVTVWIRQLRHEDAKSELLDAVQIFERLGLVEEVEGCQDLLQEVEQAMKKQSNPLPGELLERMLPPIPVDFHSPALKYAIWCLGNYLSKR
jgi:tetratricopeptide (TPR) repeat protein